jgi:hypothetical protein
MDKPGYAIFPWQLNKVFHAILGAKNLFYIGFYEMCLIR